jgi:hypothetical protein
MWGFHSSKDSSLGLLGCDIVYHSTIQLLNPEDPNFSVQNLYLMCGKMSCMAVKAWCLAAVFWVQILGWIYMCIYKFPCIEYQYFAYRLFLYENSMVWNLEARTAISSNYYSDTSLSAVKQ